MDQTRAAVQRQVAARPEPRITPHDRAILRLLAATVAELAARPIEAEKRDLWYAHNALEEQ